MPTDVAEYCYYYSAFYEVFSKFLSEHLKNYKRNSPGYRIMYVKELFSKHLYCVDMEKEKILCYIV